MLADEQLKQDQQKRQQQQLIEKQSDQSAKDANEGRERSGKAKHREKWLDL